MILIRNNNKFIFQNKQTNKEKKKNEDENEDGMKGIRSFGG